MGSVAFSVVGELDVAYVTVETLGVWNPGVEEERLTCAALELRLSNQRTLVLDAMHVLGIRLGGEVASWQEMEREGRATLTLADVGT